jgi:hypothetical protein
MTYLTDKLNQLHILDLHLKSSNHNTPIIARPGFAKFELHEPNDVSSFNQ